MFNPKFDNNPTPYFFSRSQNYTTSPENLGEKREEIGSRTIQQSNLESQTNESYEPKFHV